MKTQQILSRKNFWIIALNSTASFVLAYLLAFYINQLLLIITASMFHIPVSFNWDKVWFHIEAYQWTHDMVTTIFSAGPVVNFLLGFISLGAFHIIKEEKSHLNIFFIWFSLIAFNFFFGNLLIGNLFTKGMGYVLQWMYLSDSARLVVALIGFFGLILTAVLLRRPVLFTANSYFNHLDEKNFPFFFSSQVIIPFISGSILSIVYFIPNVQFQERYSWIGLALILFLIFKNTSDREFIYFDSDETPSIIISKPLVVMAFLLYFSLRLLLNQPHHFF